MSDAPERIYMDPDIKFPECEKQYACDIEYRRADLPPTDEECLRNEKVRALVEALTLWDAYDKSGEADGLALMLAYDAAITATRAALADLPEVKDDRP
jgi:hypothetical protein